MNKDINELKKLFEEIKKMGWIKSKRKGPTGIGYTFECLINKEEDSLSKPDFGSIEIKTRRIKSKRGIHLFGLNPDGKCENPLRRIYEKLGNKKSNFCYAEVYGNKYTKLGYFKRLKIINETKLKRLELKAINDSNEIIYLNVSWTYESIKNRINEKLKYLAIIRADNKMIDNNEYFYYENINFYKIKSFDTFIKLIEQGIIGLNIEIEKHDDGKRFSRGTNFSIHEEDIELLFDKL